MKTVKLWGHFKAIGPISHNGNEKSGNTVTFRRMDFFTSNFERCNLPYIEGNAIRGMLRRLVMKDFLERIEKDKDIDPRMYHMFYSGGNLESVTSGEGCLSLTLRRQITEWIPPLSLWGTSFLNQVLSGKMLVNKAYLVCKELSHLFADFGYKPISSEAVRDAAIFTGETFQTRRNEREVEDPDPENPIQMKVETEVIIPGSIFMHGFILHNANDIELACFRHVIDLWKEKSIIGGKSSTGNGVIAFTYPGIDQLPDPQLYIDWIQKNKVEIQKVFKAIEDQSIEQQRGLFENAEKKKKSTKSKKTSESKIKSLASLIPKKVSTQLPISVPKIEVEIEEKDKDEEKEGAINVDPK
jgi:hypothetical protein